MTEQGASVYGVPPEFMASYLLSATAAALRKRVVLVGKYRNHAQLWLMVVANSGIGKSEPLRVAFSPLFKRDKLTYEEYQQELLEWQTTCAEIKASKGKDKPEIPTKPVCKQSVISDTTPEALYQAISISGGVTLCRDELAGWFADFGRYAKSGEQEHYLSMFNNAHLTINRKEEGLKVIADPYLSIVGGIQPKVLSVTLNGKGMCDNGFVQRFLFTFPDSILKKEYAEAEMQLDLLLQYDLYIDQLCGIEGVEVKFSAESKEIFKNFSNEMTALVNATEVDYLKAMYSKMDIHLCRLAITVYAAKLGAGETDEATINAETMTYCTELCRYFVDTGEKVYHLITPLNSPQQKLTNGDLLRQLGEKYTIKSQAKLAEALGVSQQAISNQIKK